MSRVLVCGGRGYQNMHRLTEVLGGYEITELCHGGATGADRLAGEWALRNQIDYRVYPARWSIQGKSAGPRCNERMLDLFGPDLVIAFPGGVGTAHMVRIAKAAGVDVIVVDS